MSDNDHPDREGRIGHEAEFVDTTGNRKGKQRLPLGVDMDPDWPREDIPNHSGGPLDRACLISAGSNIILSPRMGADTL